MGYNNFLILITVIFSVIILFTGIAVTKKKKYNFLLENIVTYIFYLVFLYMQYKLKFHVNSIIILLSLITIIGNNFFGNYLDVYHSSKYFDRYLHALGAFSFPLFFYSILEKFTVHSAIPNFYTSIFVATIGISIGCIFEMGEFIVDITTHSKNQHSHKDTNTDLIANFIGAIMAGLVSNWII